MSEVSSGLPGRLPGVLAAPRRHGKSLWRSAVKSQHASAVILAITDVLVAHIAVLTAAVCLSRLFPPTSSLAAWEPLPAVAAAISFVAVNLQLGLYDTAGQGPIERFRLRLLGVTVMPWLAVALVAICGGAVLPTVAVLAVSWVGLLVLAPLSEVIVRHMLIGRSAWGANVVLVGSGRQVAQLATYLLVHPELGLRPIGIVGDAPEPADPNPVTWLGPLSEIEALATTADMAVIALSDDLKSVEPTLLPFRRLIVVPDVDGIPALWQRSRAIGDVLGLQFSNRKRVTTLYVKRMFDLCIAVPALVVSLPTIGILGLLIKALSPGPAFYVQRRIGLRGAPVAILKLRSMHLDAEQRLKDLLARDAAARQEWERYVKLSRDPRVLPLIGGFIRRTSIDELPQLWNVVRGDISLVGPRPFPAYHVHRFDDGFQTLRASVKPGLTGLWQVSDRSNADLDRQKALDTFYIRNWSLWLDLYIVVATVPALLSGRGAR